MKNFRLLIYILGILIFLSQNIPIVYSANYKIDKNTTYKIQNDTLYITDTQTITNLSKYSSITSEFISFAMPLYTQNASDKLNNELNTLQTNPTGHSAQYIDNYYHIKVPFDGYIGPGQTKTFEITYQSYQLYEKIGQIRYLNIPKKSKQQTEYEFNDSVTVIFPSIMESELNVSKSPSNITSTNNEKIYQYNADSLYESQTTFQFGKSQNFKFTYDYTLPKTYETKFFKNLPYNEINVITPSETEDKFQQILFSKIQPEPYKVFKDNDNNINITFLLPSDKENKIYIEGYILLTPWKYSLENIQEDKISNIDFEKYSLYLKSVTYWESESNEVQQAISEIPKSNLIYDQVVYDYKYVVEKLDYSKEKYKNNKRMGAKNALLGAESVCMEYSDLLIALLRAQKIPARAAYGKGFNSSISIEEQLNHQWVEVYFPSIGWVPFDPTWGEIGKDYFGPDFEHALWYTAGENPNKPSSFSFVIYEQIDMSQSQFIIEPVEIIPENTQSYDEIKIEQKNYIPELITSFRLGFLSRAIDTYFLYILFTIITFISIIMFILFIKLIIKLSRKNKKIE